MKSIPFILKSEVPKLDIPWINCGGCGIFALYLIRALRKMGVKATPRVIVRDSVNQETYNNAGLACIDCNIRHVVVVYEGLSYDATGIVPFGRWSGNPVDVTEKDLRYMVYKQSWNKTFERKKSIPKIKAHLNNIVETYKTQSYENR